MGLSSREMNGPRLAPLKIHKDSHLIHKPSSTSSSSTTTNTAAQQQRHHPVIIYTHSPKVIHAQARDFMALVQKLTGLSHANEDDQDHLLRAEDNTKCKDGISSITEDSSSSSSENSSVSVPAAIPLMDPLPPSHFMQDPIPLFTPNTAPEFFDSPTTSLYRYPETPYSVFPNFWDFFHSFF